MTVPMLRGPMLWAVMPLAMTLSTTGSCQRPVEARGPPLAGPRVDQAPPLVLVRALLLAGPQTAHLILRSPGPLSNHPGKMPAHYASPLARTMMDRNLPKEAEVIKLDKLPEPA